MAKSIKAIKCPQCGSTQKTQVSPEHFRCTSCGTEYFLDNDDININYTEHKTGPVPALKPNRPGLIAAIVLGVLVLLFVLPRLFYSSTPTYVTSSSGGSVLASDDEDDAPPSNKYSWSSTEEELYLNAKRQPVLFVVGGRRYEASRSQRFSQNDRDSCFASFYDASTGQELKSVPLSELNAKKSVDLDLKVFENGDLYVLANKTKVYKVDKAAYTVTDVTKTLFQGQPELGYGVASIEPVGDDKGDGFSLFTNDGRTVFYFPRIRKVYNKDEYYKAGGGMGTLRPNSATKTTFTFSSKSTSYPEDKLQLIKYKYRNNDGGPKQEPDFGWEDDYGGSGIFTDADPHKKVLITPYGLQQARVLSFNDFTAGRLYFSPGVMYSDADQVLIRFRPTAADGSAPVAQLLDAKTGAIKFTTPIPEGFDAEQALHYPNGFALRDDRSTILLGPDGKFSKPVALP